MAQARFDRREQLTGWAFVAPALVLLGLFMLYPIVWSLWMSFQVGKGMNLSLGGFTNIVRLTKDPVFIRALGNTFTFFIIQVPIMITLALLGLTFPLLPPALDTLMEHAVGAMTALQSG